MKKTFLLLISFICTLSLVSANEVSFKPVFSKLKFTLPVAAVVPPDGTDRLFLVEQGGRILLLPKDRKNGDSVEVFLDFTGREMIAHAFEEGLLGLVFHPDFKKNRKFYVYYSLQHPKRTKSLRTSRTVRIPPLSASSWKSPSLSGTTIPAI